MTDTTTAELIAREQQRCRAISSRDWAALEALLLDSYSHTHGSGVVQDKPTYLAFIKDRPRETRRGELRVRLYGNAAVMNGLQFNTPEGNGPVVESEVLQVWINDGGTWRLAANQTTRVRGK